MNLAAMSGIDPGDLTTGQRLALVGLVAADRVMWLARVVSVRLARKLNGVTIRPGVRRA